MTYSRTLISEFKAFFFDKDAVANFKERVDFSAAYFFYMILGVLGTFMITLISSLLGSLGSQAGFSPILFLILFAVLPFISGALFHLSLKIMGGKARFLDTIKVSISIYFVTFVLYLVLGLIGSILGLIPIIGLIFGILLILVNIALFIWPPVISVIIYARVHEVEWWKVLVSFILVFVMLFFIILVLMLVSFSALFL